MLFIFALKMRKQQAFLVFCSLLDLKTELFFPILKTFSLLFYYPHIHIALLLGFAM